MEEKKEGMDLNDLGPEAPAPGTEVEVPEEKGMAEGPAEPKEDVPVPEEHGMTEAPRKPEDKG